MTVAYWIGEPFDTSHERAAVQKFVRQMENRFGNSDVPYHILANFRLNGKQLDLTILKPDAVIVVDLKRFRDPFRATENGRWRTADGSGSVGSSGFTNPLQQVSEYRWNWVNYLRSKRSQFPGIGGKQQAISAVFGLVAIDPVLPDGCINDIHLKSFWFELIGFDQLPDAIANRTSNQFLLAPDELQRLVDTLNLNLGSTRTGGLTYEALKGRYRRGGVPHLPPLFVGREKDIADLKQRLGVQRVQVAASDKHSNLQVMTAMRGWPGVGKTTLATALAYEHDVVETFSDGIVWASLGESPDGAQILRRWANELGVKLSDDSASLPALSQELSLALHNLAILVIIDDVWQAAHAEPLCIAGRYGAMLITTRLDEVARALAARSQDIFLLNVLSEEASLTLLQELAPSVVAAFPQESTALVKALEGLPLALRVAGRVLNTQYERGFTIHDLLDELPSDVLDATAPSDRSDYVNATTPTVRALLKKSTDLLSDETRLYYAYLGALAPKPAVFLGYEDVGQRIWEIDEREARRVFGELMDYGLLERQDDYYTIHALLVLHAQTLLDDKG